MYQVKCDEKILLDYRDPSLILESPQVDLEVNTIGSASFTMYDTHPHYNRMKKLKSVFEVSDEIGVIFRGRMTNDSVDFDNVKDVEIEGIMGCFNDSIVRPYSFPEDFVEDADYISASESGNAVKFLLNWFIENHNSQVQDWQKFKLGEVTVSDPNNYVTRSNTKHSKTWEELKSKLFESSLGGYLCIRYEDDGNYIDYLSEFTLTNTQGIEFGSNLLDLKTDSDASNIFTAIIPIGAEIETETETTDEETGEKTTTVTKSRVTIEGLADGEITSDIVKSGDTIYSKSAVENFGWIYANVDETTWDDVTTPENLQTRAMTTLQQTGVKYTDVVEYNAADLHCTDEEIRSFRIYRNVNVNSAPHNQKGVYPLTKIQIPLLKPQDTKITVGGKSMSFSDTNIKNNQSTEIRIQKTEKDIEETRSNISSVGNQITTESSSIVNTCEGIFLEALKSYTKTGDFDSFKETVESQLKVVSDEISGSITKSIEEIVNVNGDLQKQITEVQGLFSYTIENGLVIGKLVDGEQNPYQVQIQNNEINILNNESIVQSFDAEGNSLIPKLKVTEQFEFLGFVLTNENGVISCG